MKNKIKSITLNKAKNMLNEINGENYKPNDFVRQIDKFYYDVAISKMKTAKDRHVINDEIIVTLMAKILEVQEAMDSVIFKNGQEIETLQRNIFHLQKTILHKEEQIKGKDRDIEAQAREILKLETEKENLVNIISRVGGTL